MHSMQGEVSHCPLLWQTLTRFSHDILTLPVIWSCMVTIQNDIHI